MFFKIKFNVIISVFFYAVAANAISSDAIVAEKDGKMIIAVNDIHIDKKFNKKGPHQRKLFLQNLVRINEQAKDEKDDKILVIVEDMLNYDGPNALAKEYIEKNSLRIQKNAKNNAYDSTGKVVEEDPIVDIISVLGNLTRDCLDMGIDCYNAESRQVKWVSRTEYFITGQDVAQEFDYNTQRIMCELQLIKQDAKESNVASAVYNECSKIMEQSKKTSRDSIQLLRNLTQSLKQFENEASDATIYNPLHDFYHIDARILIAWYKNRSRKTVVIIAGEDHIENIMELFEVLGYKISRYGTKFPADDEGYNQMVHNCLDFDSLFQELNITNVSSPSQLKMVSQALVPNSEPLFGNIFGIAAQGLYRWLQTNNRAPSVA